MILKAIPLVSKWLKKYRRVDLVGLRQNMQIELEVNGPYEVGTVDVCDPWCLETISEMILQCMRVIEVQQRER